ncbi:hypothetical protein RI367_001334 [Sorochytrium milnesiophthora]
MNLPCTYLPPQKRGPLKRAPPSPPQRSHRPPVVLQQAAPLYPPTSSLHTPVGGVDRDSGLDDIVKSLTLIVKLDESGQVDHIRNFGASNGLHMIARDADDLLDAPDMLISDEFSMTATTCLPDVHTLPSESEQCEMVAFYFDYYRTIFPVVDRLQLTAYLEGAKSGQHLFVAHSFFAFVWPNLRRRQCASMTTEDQAANVHLHRARQLLHSAILGPPSLEKVIGLLLLARAEAGVSGCNVWQTSGIAIRMALDMGLHLDLERFPVLKQMSHIEICRYRMVWWCAYLIDRALSVRLGRPVTIREDDYCCPLPRADPALPEEYGMLDTFATYLRLLQIQGRALQSVNRIKRRQQLPLDLPELHDALESWFAALPPHLKFDCMSQSSHAYDNFTLYLNLEYYVTVIVLYRPFMAAPAVAQRSPLACQYATMCFASAKAILYILFKARAQRLLDMLTSMVCFALSTSCTVISYIAKEDPAQREQALRYLECFLEIYKSVSPGWPMAQTREALFQNLYNSMTADTAMQEDEPASRSDIPYTISASSSSTTAAPYAPGQPDTAVIPSAEPQYSNSNTLPPISESNWCATHTHLPPVRHGSYPRLHTGGSHSPSSCNQCLTDCEYSGRYAAVVSPTSSTTGSQSAYSTPPMHPTPPKPGISHHLLAATEVMSGGHNVDHYCPLPPLPPLNQQR